MKLLLGSGGLSTPERLNAWREEFDRLVSGINRILFVPYARADHDDYVAQMLTRLVPTSHSLYGIHREKDPKTAIREAQAIFVGGGNSFRLLYDLYRHDLLNVILERVQAGVPYIGISAGTNMACPTLKTTNDMPIVQPPRFDALGLIPFQINPHYFAGAIHYEESPGHYARYGGETRDDRIREFHEMNSVPVLGLYEGSILSVENNEYRLMGLGGARLFRAKQPPLDLQAGSLIQAELLSKL